MKKSPPPKQPRSLDKSLFEAGQQCLKRLWLDAHEPADAEPSRSREHMAEVGRQLVALARSVFPKGVAIEAKDHAKAVAETQAQLAAEVPVLFGAAFAADGVLARVDILVRHRDGSLDLYEIKSGTKVKHRYVLDLALQAHVLQSAGHQVRAAYLLHLNPKYAHKEGTDFPPMQLLRSADVTPKVLKQVAQVKRRLGQFRAAVAADAPLELPMGTYCTAPFRCPHFARCAKASPALPLRELPELTHAQELELHKEGIEDLPGLDPARAGLTFRQRRTLLALRQNEPLVEPFVREELRQCTYPLHFLALLALPEALPRFEGQRPWRQLPFAWSVHTLHQDGRVTSQAFAFAERTDPRRACMDPLAQQLEGGGTILCWDDEALEGLRGLLEDLPAAKPSVRSVLGHEQLDLMRLLESGVHHPQLRDYRDLRRAVAALLGDASGEQLTVWGEDQLREALDRAAAPRIRTATREKIAAELQATVVWCSERLLQVWRKYADVQPAAPAAAPKPPRAPQKSLPKKPLPKQ